jgi:hypothetical protein
MTIRQAWTCDQDQQGWYPPPPDWVVRVCTVPYSLQVQQHLPSHTDHDRTSCPIPCTLPILTRIRKQNTYHKNEKAVDQFEKISHPCPSKPTAAQVCSKYSDSYDPLPLENRTFSDVGLTRRHEKGPPYPLKMDVMGLGVLRI